MCGNGKLNLFIQNETVNGVQRNDKNNKIPQGTIMV